jgi:hypothetical protein
LLAVIHSLWKSLAVPWDVGRFYFLVIMANNAAGELSTKKAASIGLLGCSQPIYLAMGMGTRNISTYFSTIKGTRNICTSNNYGVEKNGNCQQERFVIYIFCFRYNS